MKRVGKAGRVIAELSCGATLREMTPDLAAGTAEEEACGGAGEGAGGVDKGWVLVCGGRCVYRHGLACAERVRKALDADLLAALEGLRNRGVLTAEQAEEAKRRIAAGGAA